MTSRKGAGLIDTAELNRVLLSQADAVVARWLPNGKLQGPYVKFGGVDGAAGNSAWVKLDTGAWRDEANPSDHGSDLISLYAALQCAGDQGRALRELAAEFAISRTAATAAPQTAQVTKSKSEWRPIIPVPADAPDYRTQWGHFARGTPDQHWQYRDAEDRLLYVVCRFDTADGGKDVQPLSFCEKPNGTRAWRYMAPGEPRPLYGLHRLASPAASVVFVVEGEKCADALHQVLQLPVVTWQGGSNAARKTDWTPLRGKKVVCWPDADAKIDKHTGVLAAAEAQPGMRAMRVVEQALRALGCQVSIVDTGAPGTRPDGWDCADAIAEGWASEQLHAFMARSVSAANVAGSAPAARHAHQDAAPSPPGGVGSEGGDTSSWRDRTIFSRGLAFAADLGPVREPVERATNVVPLPARSHEGLREPVGDAAETHHDLSKAWCEGRTVGGHSPVFTAGAFYVPCGDGMWRRLSAEAVQVDLAGMFNRKKLCRKNSDYRQIADHTTALCEREEFFDDAPAGIVTPAGFHALGAGGSIETVPVQLSHRQAFALAYRPEYEAESPLLDGVLRAAFDGADMADQIDLWWQCVGASLFAMMPKLQLVLLLLGRERSGKSLLQRLLERAFPAAAVGAVSPASWGHEYHVASLAGKRLNVVGELSDDAPIPAAAFKNVTGQNLVAGRHPTHRPFSFRCMAAHVFASNVLPPTTDRTDAFYRRWRVLRFANSVAPESVDPDLLDKIVAAEMPAFLAQAFLGAERVARAGRVRTTAQHDAALAKWRLAANPLEQFLDDTDWVTLEKEPDKVDLELWPKPATVYEHYRRWAATAGFRNPFGRNHFLDLLESTGAARRVRIRRAQSHNVVAGLWLTTRV